MRGFEVAAISHSPEKAEPAKELGADHYIATADGDAAEWLKALGGAKVMVVTADRPDVIKPLIAGLAPGGEMILAATSMEPIGWSTMDFIGGVASVKGTFTDAGELESTLKFSSLFDVKPMVEEFPLEQANEALAKMLSAKTKFRAVQMIFDFHLSPTMPNISVIGHGSVHGQSSAFERAAITECGPSAHSAT